MWATQIVGPEILPRRKGIAISHSASYKKQVSQDGLDTECHQTNWYFPQENILIKIK